MTPLFPHPDLKTRAPDRLKPDPARYVVTAPLARAVNVALTLGMPLLVTGEPGCGKTQLAYRLAWELDPEDREPLRFDTQSTSVASDLFYRFDSVHHFSASQLAAARKEALPAATESITYRALGLALLRGRSWEGNVRLVSRKQAEAERLVNRTPSRSVVLVDEVDKASRDFPNDLLAQLENFRFDIPELREWGVQADAAHHPIVVITSNSERQLPEAFLRRCVYHHIELPTDDKLRKTWIDQVLDSHFGDRPERQALASGSRESGGQDAIQAYWSLRDHANLLKPPSTRELVDWLQALQAAGFDWRRPLKTQLDGLAGTWGALIKTSDDLARGLAHVAG